jgi:DNA-binding transcriptional regulator YdaS (Cro superfamily)
MNRTRRTTAVAVATGALALGVGIGAATIASADPTPTPSTSPSVTPSQPDANGTPAKAGGGPGHRGGRGLMQAENAKALADKLGVSEAKVTDALKAFREANRPAKPKQDRTDPGNRPDPAVRDAAMAKSLASALGVSEAKVKTAIEEVRSAARAERATALKTRLDAAVKAGTLTQAEADAVTKAVDQGVIRVGPR